MFCTNCGAELREGARFCPECGKAVDQASTRPESERSDQSTAASSAAENASKRPPKPEPPSFTAQANVVHNKSRVTAGLLAIFLGWLGLHKFYLGYTAPGLIMLIGFCILCFFGLGPIMAVVGFIEGLIYLTKTDQEFYRIYVAHQKEWF